MESKKQYFDRVVEELNLDTRDPFTLLLAKSFENSMYEHERLHRNVIAERIRNFPLPEQQQERKAERRTGDRGLAARSGYHINGWRPSGFKYRTPTSDRRKESQPVAVNAQELIAELRWDQRYTRGHVPVTMEKAAIEIQRLAERVRELKEENNFLTSCGVIECAIRNPSVSEYMKHWEDRAELAEQQLAECRKDAEQADATIIGLKLHIKHMVKGAREVANALVYHDEASFDAATDAAIGETKGEKP